uniref:CHK kinase-like domain-containing protein n=1 Tax=Panagrolaimus sp. ES5 TaxID=591445 RepID=A0AC34FTL5_9BILA
MMEKVVVNSTSSANDVVDVSKPIDGHTFSIGWLLDSLRSNDKTYQKLLGDKAVKDVSAKDISDGKDSLRSNDKTYQKLHGDKAVKDVSAKDISDGKGFASNVLRCVITFVDSGEDSYSTILKIPFFNTFNKSQNEQKFIDLHNSEVDFFESLASIAEAPTPKVFKTVRWQPDAGNKEGCIHMEDLSGKRKNISYFENINLSQVKCVIKHLAKIHKNILCADPTLWKGKYLKNQESFVDFLDMFDPIIEPHLKKCKIEDQLRPLVEKYHSFSVSKEFCLYAFKQSYKDLNIPPVLVHGDLHFNNILWATDKNGDVKNEICAFVDWQTIQEGSPMSDLARFLVNCCDGVVRRQAEEMAFEFYLESEEMAFEFYLECLTKEFGGDSKKVPYTIEQLKTAYNYAFLTQCFFIIGLPDFFLGMSKITDEKVKEAHFDFGVSKTLHAYQDADRLLQGEMKDVFEKYGK